MSTKDFQVFPGPSDDVTVASSFEPAELSGWIFIKLHIDPLAGRQMPSIELPLVVGFEADHVRRGIITQIDLSKLKRADSSPPHS
jgi:hypothetical protein